MTTSIATNVIAVAAIAASLSLSAQAHAQRVGTICTENHAWDPNHQDAMHNPAPGPYLNQLVGATSGCNDFRTNVGGTSVFGWNTIYGELHALESRTPFWESTVEGADIVYVVGHGNSQGSSHLIFGNRINDAAASGSMQLGNTGNQLKILSIWSCNSLTPPAVSDGMPLGAPFPDSVKIEYGGTGADVWTRWSRAMSGGLKMITGSWASLKNNRIQQLSADYGTYLRNGAAVWPAWRDAVLAADSTNTPIALATGRDMSECTSRLWNMTLSGARNNTTYPAYRDTQVAAYCWQAWW